MNNDDDWYSISVLMFRKCLMLNGSQFSITIKRIDLFSLQHVCMYFISVVFLAWI